MGRKRIINKDDIILASINIIRESGFKELSARTIARELECSTQPIYNRFDNIEAIHNALVDKSYRIMIDKYLLEETGEDPFLNLGLGMIKFAKEDSRIFEYLYLSKYRNRIKEADQKNLIQQMKTGDRMNSLEDEIAIKIHEKISIFTFGLAVKVMQNPNLYTAKEIRKLLIETARGITNWERR